MRNQYKVLSEKYEQIQESVVEARKPGTPKVVLYVHKDGTTAYKSLTKWGKRQDWSNSKAAHKAAGIPEPKQEVNELVREDGMETDWTGTINNKQVTITLPEVLEYLKNVPVKEVNTKQLEHLRVGAVKKPDEAHLKRINQSNLDYPIIVIASEGKYKMLLDGNHRLQKALYNNIPKIKVKVLDLDTAPLSYQQMFR